MADTPTAHELARDIARLEDRQATDRVELRKDIQDGFTEIKLAIAGLDFVSRDVYAADMRRLEGEVEDLRDKVQNAMRVFIGGFLVVIAVAVVVGLQ
jgi:hypothetical protein